MPVSSAETVPVGFVGLTDCAPILVAQELGFDRQCGIRIEPVKLKSWTAVRDALAFEQVSCANMPGALALAMHLGISGVQVSVRAPILLGYGGNAITISVALYERACELVGRDYRDARAESAQLVKAVVAERKAAGERKVRLGTVHAFSSHNYELRAWLAHAGVDPVNDLELIVVPRNKMVEALKAGQIDGFCVGDPWGQQAVETGVGVTVATKADLYPYSPEKVLAFRDGWVKGHCEIAEAVVAAVSKALHWSSLTENHLALSEILTYPENLDVSPALIRRALSCSPVLVAGQEPEFVENYLRFEEGGRSGEETGLWLLAQMQRWGQVPAGLEGLVRGVFEPLRFKVSSGAAVLANDNPARAAFDGFNIQATL